MLQLFKEFGKALRVKKLFSLLLINLTAALCWPNIIGFNNFDNSIFKIFLFNPSRVRGPLSMFTLCLFILLLFTKLFINRIRVLLFKLGYLQVLDNLVSNAFTVILRLPLTFLYYGLLVFTKFFIT